MKYTGAHESDATAARDQAGGGRGVVDAGSRRHACGDGPKERS
jgi:hypothetical protein